MAAFHPERTPSVGTNRQILSTSSPPPPAAKRGPGRGHKTGSDTTHFSRDAAYTLPRLIRDGFTEARRPAQRAVPEVRLWVSFTARRAVFGAAAAAPVYAQRRCR